MIKIEVKVDPAILHLDRVSDRRRAAIRGEVISLTQQLAALVRQKLSGPVLNRRSGALYNSIKSQLIENPSTIYGTVYSQGVPYAAVHEFGGRGYYPIVPVRAKALAFMVGGKLVFAQRVNHPPAKERSFLRSSLNDMRDQIIARLSSAAKTAAKAA